MKPFVLRYEERTIFSVDEAVVLRIPLSSAPVEQLANQTGTKTLTEVKAESGDKDRAAHSCRAFQFESV